MRPRYAKGMVAAAGTPRCRHASRQPPRPFPVQRSCSLFPCLTPAHGALQDALTEDFWVVLNTLLDWGAHPQGIDPKKP